MSDSGAPPNSLLAAINGNHNNNNSTNNSNGNGTSDDVDGPATSAQSSSSSHGSGGRPLSSSSQPSVKLEGGSDAALLSLPHLGNANNNNNNNNNTNNSTGSSNDGNNVKTEPNSASSAAAALSSSSSGSSSSLSSGNSGSSNGPGGSPAEQAAHWMKLAESGNAEAQYRIGLMWLAGFVHPGQDPAQGVAWLRRAAEQHFPAAHLYLGGMCERVPAMLQAAVNHYREV
jgi:TPR repeat protein